MQMIDAKQFRTGRLGSLAKFLAASKITNVLEALPRQGTLIALTYHRIGNGADGSYDPGVFSATQDELDLQLKYLKSRFHVTSLQEVLELVEGRRVPEGPTILVTFDDGYIDNYTAAFPVLKSHGIEGVFFLATAFVGSGRLPWWDAVGYIIRNSKKRYIRLTYPKNATFDLKQDTLERAIRRVLAFYRCPLTKDYERVFSELETACDMNRPDVSNERCFMNWAEAREMQQAGMAFGSHTHTHPILANLNFAQQKEEFRCSRAIMEAELGKKVDTLAYPYGQKNSFSEISMKALEETGYRAAFSFYGGVNRTKSVHPLDIRRFDPSGTYNILRLRMSVSTTFGATWP
jgi:peptidoglycan/xylan/chitin deacetylase (PgdA/CDA1 family)